MKVSHYVEKIQILQEAAIRIVSLHHCINNTKGNLRKILLHNLVSIIIIIAIITITNIVIPAILVLFCLFSVLFLCVCDVFICVFWSELKLICNCY
jgi:hypothetical protein